MLYACMGLNRAVYIVAITALALSQAQHSAAPAVFLSQRGEITKPQAGHDLPAIHR